MEWKGVFSKCIFLEFFFSIKDVHIFNTLCTNLHHVCPQLNLNTIQHNLNLIQWNLNSIQWNLNSIQCIWIESTNLNLIQIQFNSSCMQCASIFPFKWTLIFTKSTQFFHHFIVANNMQQCENQVDKIFWLYFLAFIWSTYDYICQGPILLLYLLNVLPPLGIIKNNFDPLYSISKCML
jgi:hypothetical protein